MSFTLLLILNLLGWILFLVIFRIVVRRAVKPTRILGEIETEVDSLVTELNGTTERNIRLLEEAILRLKRATDQADKRLRIMQGELKKRDEESPPPRPDYSHLASRKPISLKVVEDEEEAPSPAPVEEDSAENENGDIRESIVRLYRQGIDSRLIASRVGRPVGEVELIISLMEKTDR